MNNKTKYVATTGIMLAMLIIIQLVFRSFGQIFTGTGVNMVLAISALYLGYAGSITLAVLSPVFAFLLGIGPAFLPIVPCIILGNLSYVLLICAIDRKLEKRIQSKAAFCAVIIASIIKFAVLYLTVVLLAVPALGLPPEKQNMISSMFSLPQLITALAGGLIALVITYYVKKSKTPA